MLRRLKVLGASRCRLLDVLQKQEVSTLLLAVQAWDCLLTVQERQDIEQVLNTGLRINKNTLHLKKFYVQVT